MSDETFNIKFSEDGAENVIQKMRSMADAGQTATRSTEDLSDALGRVRNKANPAQAAYESLARGIYTLDKAQRANLITSGEQARLQTNLIAQSSQALRPFSSMIGSIQAETRAWGENATARAVAQRVMAQTQTLQRAGVVLNAEERESLIATNLAAVQAREAARTTAAAARQAAAEQRQAAAAAERAAEQEATAQQRRSVAISSLLSKIGAETEAVGLNTVERQANLRTIQQAESLRTVGIALTSEETSSILAQNTAYAEQRAAVASLAEAERGLAGVRRTISGAGPGGGVQAKVDEQRAAISRAGAVGLINPAEQAALERELAGAYASQLDPLAKASSLIRQRAEYQRGLFESGRALAQVEREITSALGSGAVAESARIAALKSEAREVDRLDRAYKLLNEAKGFANNVIGGFGLLLGAGAAVRGLDEGTNIRNQIGVTSTSDGNKQDVTTAVYKTALDTHTAVEDTARAYSRINLAVQRYDYGQQRVLAITKTLNEEIRLSGAAEGEATRASLDFVHSISSGNVQFREIRALSTQAHFVVKDIADGLTKLARADTEQGKAFAARAKKAGVDTVDSNIGVGQLKELTSGKAIGSKDIFAAIELQADSTQKAFDKLTPTIRQSLTDLNTQFVKFLDNLNQGTGVAGNVARSIEFIGRNLSNIIAVGGILAGLLAGLFIKEKLEEFGASISVVGQKIGLIKTVTTENSLATDGNSAALNTNTGAQAANKAEIDAVTTSLARQIVARREASSAAAVTSTPITAGGAQAARAEALAANGGAPVAFGRRGAPAASVAAGGAAAAGAEIAGVEANAARAASGIGGVTRAAVAGVAGVATEAVGFVGSILGGLTAALPLIFALGAAWLLLKDNIVLAKEQTLAFSQDGNTSAIQGTITLGDVAGGVFDLIAGKAQDSATVQKAASKDAADADAKAKQGQLDKAKTTFAQTGNYYDQLHDGLVKSTVDFVTKFVVGATFIGQTFQIAMVGIYAAAEKIVQQVTNLVIDFYNNAVVPVLNAAHSIGVGGGAEKQNHVQIKDGDAAYQRLLANRTETTNSLLTHLPNALAGAIVRTAGNRQTSRGPGLTSGNGDGADDDFGKKKDKKPKKDPLDNEFDQLLKKTFPAVEAVKAFNKEMDVLAKGTQKGLLSIAVRESNAIDKEHPEYGLGQLTDKQASDRIKAGAQKQLQSAVNPVGDFQNNQRELRSNLDAGNGDPFQRTLANKITAEEVAEAKKLNIEVGSLSQTTKDLITNEVRLTSAKEQEVKVNDALREQKQDREREISLLGATSEVVTATAQAYSIYKDQLLAGVPGAQAAYRTQITANLQFIAQKENIEKTKNAYDAIVGPAKQYQDTVVNLNNLLDAGKISLAKYNEELRDGTIKALGSAKDGFSGFERGLLSVKKETEDTASDMESTFKDAYNNIQSGFSSLFTGGSLKDAAHKVFEGLTNDLSKTLFHKLTDPLVNSVGSKFGIPGFGDKQLAAQRADITATNVYVNGADASSLGNLGLGSNPLATGFAGGNYSGLTNPFAANDNGVSGLFGSAGNLFSSGNLLTGGIASPTVGAGLDTLRLPGLDGTGTSLFGGAGGLSSLFGGAGGITALAGGAGAAGGLLGGAGGGGGGLLGGLFGGLLGAGKSAAGGASSAISGGLGLLANFLPPPFNLLGGLLGGGGGGGLLSFLPHFATGGEGVVTGTGGTDSKLVSLMATPGESLQVKTPAQQREGQSGGEAPVVNQKIVNVVDPGAALDAMATQAGFKTILNHIQSNPEAIKRALGS